MICENVAFRSPWITKIYALRQAELRAPLNLNLFAEDLLSEEDEYFFIAYQNEELFSCLQLKPMDNRTLKLRQMATQDKSQGQGYGKQLVSFAEQWSKENGFKKIELHARRIAQGFYEKLAYQKVGDEFLEVAIPHFKMMKVL